MTALPAAPPASVRRGATRPGHLLRVFEHEPDLLEGLDAATAEMFRIRGVARGMMVEQGAWAPPAEARPDALGLLVVDGLVTRCVTVLGRACPELLGAGDLLRPWDPPAPLPACAAGETTWRALTPVTIAVLDGRFAAMVGTQPAVMAALLGRANARARALTLHLAIAHIRHAETRLLLLLWHLAERWGRVTPSGTVLTLPLTHELLADLTAMRRPTASTALQQLIRSGRLERAGRRRWILHGAPPTEAELSAA